ncbi:hypothetical protein D3C80_1606080 [compost metagenome]
MFLHQPVIGGDVRFTFGSIEDQRAGRRQAAGQFAGGRETGTAQPGDPRLTDALIQLIG